jgi:pyridinium-3,5-bisthiocarboxylic acid mononucleotide nickel chelatase
MKILYFDCFSGISGDMTVGALLDLGVPQEHLIEELDKLGISDEYEINIKKSAKNGIEGTDFDVQLKEHHHHHDHDHHHEHHHGRNLFDIEGLIDKSDLDDNVKKISKDIFKVLAEAEAKVHGKDIYEVHFHEVGAVDSIVDIVGAAICIDYIKPDIIMASSINTGSGFVKCQHGVIPVPAPATLNILKDVPIYCDDREFELTTPTGAAIIKTLVSEFKKLSEMKIKKVGYGCGKRDTEKPNVLRIVLAEDASQDTCILEATIDDMNPQIYGYLMDKLFDAGAKDVYYTPIYMKKNRPGIVVTITVPTQNEDKIKEVMFRETTTIGIRKFNIERTELNREFEKINTEFGDITLKFSSYNGNVVNIKPEYEDIKNIAEKMDMPLKEVYRKVSHVLL